MNNGFAKDVKWKFEEEEEWLSYHILKSNVFLQEEDYIHLR
jgi:hypothetical protein